MGCTQHRCSPPQAGSPGSPAGPIAPAHALKPVLAGFFQWPRQPGADGQDRGPVRRSRPPDGAAKRLGDPLVERPDLLRLPRLGLLDGGPELPLVRAHGMGGAPAGGPGRDSHRDGGLWPGLSVGIGPGSTPLPADPRLRGGGGAGHHPGLDRLGARRHHGHVSGQCHQPGALRLFDQPSAGRPSTLGTLGPYRPGPVQRHRRAGQGARGRAVAGLGDRGLPHLARPLATLGPTGSPAGDAAFVSRGCAALVQRGHRGQWRRLFEWFSGLQQPAALHQRALRPPGPPLVLPALAAATAVALELLSAGGPDRSRALVESASERCSGPSRR